MTITGPSTESSRPNELWVSDLTYVRLGSSFCYVAFIIDVFARMIVGWQISRSLRSELALEALEQAISERLGEDGESLVHHSDRGGHYLSLRYTERLALAGIEPSVGSRGDSYDNALAETIIGLYKTELIELRSPWTRFEDVELATLEWVWWFNNRRLLHHCHIVNIRGNSYRMRKHADLSKALLTPFEEEEKPPPQKRRRARKEVPAS